MGMCLINMKWIKFNERKPKECGFYLATLPNLCQGYLFYNDSSKSFEQEIIYDLEPQIGVISCTEPTVVLYWLDLEDEYMPKELINKV